MESKMRRSDRAITQAETEEILNKGEYGILSTVSAAGQPYGVPLSYRFMRDVLYFHCAMEGHKLENIKANQKVSFCVVGKTQVLPAEFATNYESAMVFGEALEVTDNEKQAGLVAILEKYSPDFIKEGLEYIEQLGKRTKVYKIVIEMITGKARR